MKRSTLPLLVRLLACLLACLALPQCGDSGNQDPDQPQKRRSGPANARQPFTGPTSQRPERQEPEYMKRAREHLAQRPPQPKQALAILLPKQEENAAHAEFLYLLGQCLERLRRFNQAFDVLQQAHNLDPTNPAYLYDMGSCRFNQAMFRESLHIWRELESLEARIPHQGQRARISFNRGACAKELEFNSEAIEAFSRAVALAENKLAREHYLYDLAGLQLNNHRYDAAAEEFATLKTLAPGKWEYPYYLGVAQLGLDKLDDAEANLLNARRLGPKEARIPIKLGNLYMRRSKEDHAEGYYMEALEKNPLADEPMRKLMMINRNRGDAEVAADYSKRYRKIEKQSTEITETLRALRRRIISNPKDLPAHKQRVEIFLKHDRRQDASKSLSKMLAYFPDNDWGILNTAFLLARGGRRQDALYELDKIIEKDPNHAFANRDAGQILGSMGRMKECIPYFERSLATFKGQTPPDLRALLSLHQMLATAYNKVADAPRTKLHVDAYKKLKEQLDKAAGEKGN